ncbi:hypothetical protein NLU13_5980 [Sarocladium strictum]|uniref:Uncharacterized protein n=1 Tax=Sarocladium strictum TaxID=5046 RepID=A0AA39GGB7_SARSR|nr:hypothetical protein NLU13_5980 [Sarocladium strictum]
MALSYAELFVSCSNTYLHGNIQPLLVDGDSCAGLYDNPIGKTMSFSNPAKPSSLLWASAHNYTEIVEQYPCWLMLFSRAPLISPSRITPSSAMDPQSLSDARDASLPVQIRLTFVVLLLIHQFQSFIVEMCYISTQPAPLFKQGGQARALISRLGWRLIESDDPMEPPPTWTWRSRTQWVVANGLSMCFVAVVFSVFAFRGAAGFQRTIKSQCDATVDGDIAGIGVRVGAWIQIAMFIFIIGASELAKERFGTAAKELAGGLVVTHLALGISLVVLLRQGRLSALNAAVGTMVLDAQNAALSVSFSSKDVLAARWGVVAISVSQFVGLTWIGLLMGRYQVGRCFSFFWWSWHDTCSGVPRMETSIFWVYYEFRWLGSLHNWLFGLRYMWDFHDWEAKSAKAGPLSEPFWVNVHDTVGFSWYRYSVFGLVSMIAAELVLTSHGSGGGNEDFTVGQVIGLVIAGITVLRALWLFLMAFRKRKEEHDKETILL